MLMCLMEVSVGQGLPASKLGVKPAAQEKSAPEKPGEQEKAQAGLRIAWVGDIVMEVAWRQPPSPPKPLFDGVRKRLLDSDLVIANLESPLTDWSTMTPHKDKADIETGRDVVLRVASPDAAPALHEAGISVVGLANNHTMDYTERGFRDTLKRLRAAGVSYAGGGKNLAAAEAPLIVEIKGRKVGILSFSDVVPRYFWAENHRPGIATAKEDDRLLAAVRRARPKVDILIVALHWGVQFSQEPSPRQLSLAREAQQAGADLILGAHPHVLQGVGCLGRVPVVYSAGNFVFPTMKASTRRTAIFEFEFSSSRPPVVRLVPAVLDDRGAPQLVEGESRQSILSEMNQLSLPLGLRFDGDSGACSEAPSQERPA